MTKSTPLLDLYNNYMGIERLPSDGLCNSIIYLSFTHYGLNGSKWNQLKEALDLVSPTNQDLKYISRNTVEHLIYWGYGKPGPISNSNLYYEFTPLRQNLVLLMSQILGEY